MPHPERCKIGKLIPLVLAVMFMTLSCTEKAAPLVAAGLHRFDAALIGMLVFQFTMPVTLAAVYLVLPQRPGLAFGLPCLALLIGALPGLTGLFDPAALKPLAAPLVLLSALMLFVGLRQPLDAGKPIRS